MVTTPHRYRLHIPATSHLWPVRPGRGLLHGYRSLLRSLIAENTFLQHPKFLTHSRIASSKRPIRKSHQVLPANQLAVRLRLQCLDRSPILTHLGLTLNIFGQPLREQLDDPTIRGRTVLLRSRPLNLSRHLPHRLHLRFPLTTKPKPNLPLTNGPLI